MTAMHLASVPRDQPTVQLWAYTGDYVTCTAVLSLALRERRGHDWGATCGTLAPLDDFPACCPYCGSRVA